MKLELHDISDVVVLQMALEHGINDLKIRAKFDNYDISQDTMQKLEKLNDYLKVVINND